MNFSAQKVARNVYIPLMEEIMHQLINSLSRDLKGFYISQVVQDFFPLLHVAQQRKRTCLIYIIYHVSPNKVTIHQVFSPRATRNAARGTLDDKNMYAYGFCSYTNKNITCGVIRSYILFVCCLLQLHHDLDWSHSEGGDGMPFWGQSLLELKVFQPKSRSSAHRKG